MALVGFHKNEGRGKMGCNVLSVKKKNLFVIQKGFLQC